MQDDPVYFTFDEFKACFPTFFVDVNAPTPAEQEAAENIIREAQSLVDVYINCEKCKTIKYDCYYCYSSALWGCTGFNKSICPPALTFPRCVDCCPGSDQGTFDAATEPLLPKDTIRFQYWLVSDAGTVEGLTMAQGDYIVALATRAVTTDVNFSIVTEEPKTICFVPDNIRRAMKILVGSLIEINSTSGSGDCLDGLNVSIGDFKLSNANDGANNETRLPYTNQYYDLLAPYRCRGAIIQ